MAMSEDEWFQFVAQGNPDIVSVTRLEPDLCRAVACSSNLVRYQHVYALKAAQKHKLRAAHFPMLPIIIECGFAVQDRLRCLSSIGMKTSSSAGG